jgi:hypothetical protein
MLKGRRRRRRRENTEVEELIGRGDEKFESRRGKNEQEIRRIGRKLNKIRRQRVTTKEATFRRKMSKREQVK